MSNRNDILRFLSRLYLNNFIDYNILRFDAQENKPTLHLLVGHTHLRKYGKEYLNRKTA